MEKVKPDLPLFGRRIDLDRDCHEAEREDAGADGHVLSLPELTACAIPVLWGFTSGSFAASTLFVDPCASSGKAESDSFFFPHKSIVEIYESVRAKPVVNMPVYTCVGHPDAETGIKVRPRNHRVPAIFHQGHGLKNIKSETLWKS
jgi:hypothetical protein